MYSISPRFSRAVPSSLNFNNFFAVSWFEAVQGVPPSKIGFQAYCLTFLFFKKTENCNSCGVLGFLEFVVLLGGANSKKVGTFFRWAGQGPSEVFRKFFRPMVCGAASCIRIPFSSCRVFSKNTRKVVFAPFLHDRKQRYFGCSEFKNAWNCC